MYESESTLKNLPKSTKNKPANQPIDALRWGLMWGLWGWGEVCQAEDRSVRPKVWSVSSLWSGFSWWSGWSWLLEWSGRSELRDRLSLTHPSSASKFIILASIFGKVFLTCYQKCFKDFLDLWWFFVTCSRQCLEDFTSLGWFFLICSQQCSECFTDLCCWSRISFEYSACMAVSKGQWNLQNLGGQVRRNLSSLSKQFGY